MSWPQFQLDFSRIQIRRFTAWANLLLDKVLHSAPISLQNALHTVHNWIPGPTGFADLWTVFLTFAILESVRRWISDRNFIWNWPRYISFLGTVPERKWQKKQHCVQYQFYPHLQEGLESGEQLGLLKLLPIPILNATHPPTSPKRMKRASSEKEWR